MTCDYSDVGAKRHNPDTLTNITVGDIYKSLDNLISDSAQFDVVNMDNLLEHVTDPKVLLQKSYGLLKDNGIVIIKVPNDFSPMQNYFYKNGIIQEANWVAYPDHISYFNRGGLINICNAVNFECIDFLSDQLVEFFALNSSTNYFENRVVGRPCHLAAISLENIFHSISPDNTLELYRILGAMELGRQIIGVFKKR